MFEKAEAGGLKSSQRKAKGALPPKITPLHATRPSATRGGCRDFNICLASVTWVRRRFQFTQSTQPPHIYQYVFVKAYGKL